MLDGVSLESFALPPDKESLKSDASKLPLPPVALNTGSLNVTASFEFAASMLMLDISGVTFVAPSALLKILKYPLFCPL